MPTKIADHQRDHAADALAGVPLHLLVGLVVVDERPDPERDEEQQHRHPGGAHLPDRPPGLRVLGVRGDAGHRLTGVAGRGVRRLRVPVRRRLLPVLAAAAGTAAGPVRGGAGQVLGRGHGRGFLWSVPVRTGFEPTDRPPSTPVLRDSLRAVRWYTSGMTGRWRLGPAALAAGLLLTLTGLPGGRGQRPRTHGRAVGRPVAPGPPDQRLHRPARVRGPPADAPPSAGPLTRLRGGGRPHPGHPGRLRARGRCGRRAGRRRLRPPEPGRPRAPAVAGHGERRLRPRRLGAAPPRRGRLGRARAARRHRGDHRPPARRLRARGRRSGHRHGADDGARAGRPGAPTRNPAGRRSSRAPRPSTCS